MSIILDSVCKAFDGEKVIDKLSLAINEHEHVALMGPSGCGKTTLANLILGIIKPDEGRLTVTEGTRFSAVFQENRLIEQLDAVTNIRLALDSGKSLNDTIVQELALVGLSGDSKLSDELSGGMKRRVAIVRAILAPSDVLVMDEPFTGLDDSIKQQAMSYVNARIGERTFILITHDRSEADYFSSRIINF